jgi:glucose-6-phosphate 1-dehydrogenase
MVSRVIPVETFDLVIFGGTGDLARRKILPKFGGSCPEQYLLARGSWRRTVRAGYSRVSRDDCRAVAEFQ